MPSITKQFEAKLQSEAFRQKLKGVIRAKFKEGKTHEDIAAWLERLSRRLDDSVLEFELGALFQEVDAELNPASVEDSNPLTREELYAKARKLRKAEERSRIHQGRVQNRIDAERNAIIFDPATRREIRPGHPDHPATNKLSPNTKKRTSRPGAYLSEAAREWLARFRRQEGEVGLFTLTQNVAEALVRLPPRQVAAYQYMRALALNREHPGGFYISHETLGKKLGASEPTAERVTSALRKCGLIKLARRGSGLSGTANFYTIRPLTQDLLQALNPSSVRGPSPSPVRDPRLSEERKTAGAVRGHGGPPAPAKEKRFRFRPRCRRRRSLVRDLRPGRR
jgi:hypothetical protein